MKKLTVVLFADALEHKQYVNFVWDKFSGLSEKILTSKHRKKHLRKQVLFSMKRACGAREMMQGFAL